MKKTLIILILISFSFSQVFSLTNWSQLSLNYFSTNAKHNIDIVTGASQDADNINTKGKFGLQYKHELAGRITENFSFDVMEDIFYSEKSHEQRNSFLTNDIKLRLFYSHQATYLKLQFGNRYYEAKETNFLNLPGVEYNTQQRMVYNAVLHFKQDFGKLNLNIYSSFRDLEYVYAFPNEDDDDKMRDDDDDEYRGRSGNDFDAFADVKLSYEFVEHLEVFGRVYHKNDLNDFGEFDLTKIGFGLEFENRFNLFNSLFARFTYFNNKSDTINDEKDHYFLTESRFTKRFSIPVSGFISYINRSCYDEDQSKLFRISNMIRVHLKYSYLSENQKDSFILAGIKYNPENEGNLVFMELNQFLFEDFYISWGSKLAPELYSQNIGKLEYFFTPIRSIWMKAEITNFENKFSQTILSLGSTIIF